MNEVSHFKTMGPKGNARSVKVRHSKDGRRHLGLLLDNLREDHHPIGELLGLVHLLYVLDQATFVNIEQ
jgi:hypothetical protein